MQWRRIGFLFFAWGCLLLGPGTGFGAAAQTAGVAPQASLTAELQSLASRAAVVFAGQVISIERRGSAVEITFRVDESVVGEPGASYTLREWAGLWPPGQYRYTVGQRALIFLRGTSPAGLGSPVDGAEGVVPIVVQGSNAPALLDVRRLASALLRSVGTPLATDAEGAVQLPEAVALIAAARNPRAPRPHDPKRVRLPVTGNAPRLGDPIVPPANGPEQVNPPLTMALAGRAEQHTEVQDGAR